MPCNCVETCTCCKPNSECRVCAKEETVTELTAQIFGGALAIVVLSGLFGILVNVLIYAWTGVDIIRTYIHPLFGN